MPTYDYVCQACNHSFDELQTITEPPLKKCPKCGKSKLQRLFGTGAAILFKGSGFYETDYRSESYKSAAKADKESGAKPTADTNGKYGPEGAPGANSSASGKKGETKTSKSKPKASDD